MSALLRSLRAMFTRRWILTTLVVLAGTAVLARLGVWQLDRLEQRRAFNARVTAQQNLPELTLDAASLNEDLYNMEYRAVSVRGVYDFANEVALRNQAQDGRYGLLGLEPAQIHFGNVADA